jgi:TRAP-type C4-dicarboxylate transport system permease small subunit
MDFIVFFICLAIVWFVIFYLTDATMETIEKDATGILFLLSIPIIIPLMAIREVFRIYKDLMLLPFKIIKAIVKFLIKSFKCRKQE